MSCLLSSQRCKLEEILEKKQFWKEVFGENQKKAIKYEREFVIFGKQGLFD